MKQGMLQRVRVPVGWTLKDERGVTGLETAIILIAFVVVASVFAFTVLSTGIFSAERGKETVFAGLQEARGTIETKGGVIANAVAEDVIDSGDDVWVAGSGEIVVTAETTSKKEGTAAAQLIVLASSTTGVMAYEDLAASVDLTDQTQLSFWIKSDVTLAAGTLEVVLDEDITCSTIGNVEAQVDVPALTADTWAYVTAAITDDADAAVVNGDKDSIDCVGINVATDVGAADTTIIIDDIRAGGLVTTVQLGITNAVEGEPVNLFQPSDADADGIADTDSKHVLVITYTDKNQLVRDLNWTTSFLGDNDSDDLLEAGERAEITVELDGLADATPLIKDQEFTLEIKPAIGAVMVIKRRTPSIIDTVMNLN